MKSFSPSTRGQGYLAHADWQFSQTHPFSVRLLLPIRALWRIFFPEILQCSSWQYMRSPADIGGWDCKDCSRSWRSDVAGTHRDYDRRREIHDGWKRKGCGAPRQKGDFSLLCWTQNTCDLCHLPNFPHDNRKWTIRQSPYSTLGFLVQWCGLGDPFSSNCR